MLRELLRFVGNDWSKVVHTDDCEYAAKIHPDYVVAFSELYDAVGQEFRECNWCLGDGRTREVARRIIATVRSNQRGECLICGETRGVQAAHITPRRMGGTATMPLCPNHHWFYDHGLLTAGDVCKVEAYLSERRVA